jgi:hypothetical protein
VVKRKAQLRRDEFEILDASLPGYELGGRGIELSWQLQNNGKKGIRLCKEDFMFDTGVTTVLNPLPR